MISKKMKLRVVLLSMVFLTSCGGNQAKKESDESPTIVEKDSVINVNEDVYTERFTDLQSYLTDRKPDPKDIHEIASTCVIVVTPTIQQMEAMEKEYGDDFESVVDDAFYYQGIALGIIDSLNLTKIDAKQVNFLNLKGESESYLLDIRKKGLPEWNIIFFNTGKQPEIISAIDLTPEKANSYYSTTHP